MTGQAGFRDPRVAGAAFALALDMTLLVGGALLVWISLSPAFGLVLAGTAGLLVAPVVGWRYGCAATSRRAVEWAPDALRSVLLVSAAIVVALIALQALFVPVEGGVAGRIALVAYAALMDTIVVGLLTLAITLLLGYAWARMMRWFARSVSRS